MELEYDGGLGGEEEEGGGAGSVREGIAEEVGEVGGGAWEAKVGEAGWWREKCHGAGVWRMRGVVGKRKRWWDGGGMGEGGPAAAPQNGDGAGALQGREGNVGPVRGRVWRVCRISG